MREREKARWEALASQRRLIPRQRFGLSEGGPPIDRLRESLEGCVESMWDFAGSAAAPSWARNVTGQNGAVNPSAAECRMAHRLYLHGIGCLVFDGTCWRPGRGVDVFRRPSFDGENLG